MSYTFFPMIARMRYINRWGLMRNTQTENVQEHSHMVAILAHALAVIEREQFHQPIDPGEVAVVALYHDAGEILTGDLPTPIKYDNPELQAAYQAVERSAEQKLLSKLPPSLRPTYTEILHPIDPMVKQLVKAADKLSAYLKCVEEWKAGNREFLTAKEEIFSWLQQQPCPSLQYFMNHFLAGFEQNLDELQQEDRKDLLL